MVYCRRILVILFIFLFIFTSVCFGATIVNPTDVQQGIGVQYDNAYLTLYNMQYNTQTEFINYCYANFTNPKVKKVVSVIYSQFAGLGLNGKFMSITEPTNESVLFIVYFSFLGNCTSSVMNYSLSDRIGFANVPCLSGTFYNVVTVRNNNIWFPDTTEEMSNRPLAWCQCIHEGFPQLFKDFGLIDNVKDYTDSLGNIKNAIDNTNKTMQKVDSTIKSESNNIQNSIQDATNSINDTLTDDNVDDVPIDDLPTDNTNDITESGFNTLYETIEDIFINGESKNIEIRIPFTDKTFVISPSSVYGDTSRLGWVKTFIEAWYFFFISLFIVKDISNKINKIKSGNIENVQPGDIKADIL